MDARDQQPPRREPPSQPRSSYDPHARRISLAPQASLFEQVHERAHKAQHEHRTLRWRLHEAIPGWMPYLHRITRILVELEANQIALGTLKRIGRLDRHAKAEARAIAWRYLRKLLLFTQ